MKRLLVLGIPLLFLAACSSETTQNEIFERYTAVAEHLRETVRSDGTRAAADLLRALVEEDPELADVCHGLSHEIGHEAYLRYGFPGALEVEDDVCGSGLLHGIIETHLSGVPDLESALFTLCPERSAKCHHGLGHGLMDRSSNDLPWALAQCDRFTIAQDRIQCAEGVFMENTDVDTSAHPTAYAKPEDPYFPCRNQSSVHEGVCAFYMPRYYLKIHPRDYDGLLAACVQVPAGPRDACYKGLGSATMKQNILDPVFAESICERVPKAAVQLCIAGLSSYFVVHHASAIKGEAMCALLKEEHRGTCLRIADESRSQYPD